MTRRERLMKTLRGEPVDRPAVCFYEITGFDEDPNDPSPCNVFSHPSWQPVLELARDRTDRIVRRYPTFPARSSDAFREVNSYEQHGAIFVRTKIRAGKYCLTSLRRRDPDINTWWTLEPLLKNRDDLRLWLKLPDDIPLGAPDISNVQSAEQALGQTGLVMLDTPDPLCMIAELFEMSEYLVVALEEPALFHKALEKAARWLWPAIEAVARELPGRLWRIYGPEYASPPYLPPHLFREYVLRYDQPMVTAIQKYGGFARTHAHGRLRDILDDIAATGCVGLDPIEPPPQGDVELAWVREHYGHQMVLFGNIEVVELETLDASAFTMRVRQALRDGTRGEGRGFVLMPSACPAGRVLSPTARTNYEIMVTLAETA